VERKGATVDRAIRGLQRLTDLFERRRSQLAREVGLTDAQWRMLEEVARDDFMPSLFARRTEAHRAAVSRTLRQLQERELVTASISSADGRQRDYAVTARGRRALERLRSSRERAIDAVWAGLPTRDLERFADFAETLADRLEAYARDQEGRGEG
jgi:DNA-binding MarR family transcriptional regulator